ncbi:MAG: hypothetical protein M0C28_36395 [Candidatus Moduliflexus flocculans]|nr:hypothetical protein [Candidatus Moduliflexus flocculans]
MPTKTIVIRAGALQFRCRFTVLFEVVDDRAAEGSSAPLLCRKSRPDGKNGNEDNCTANNDVSSGHDIFLIVGS